MAAPTTPPPFDPELDIALTELRGWMPAEFNAEFLQLVRQATSLMPVDPASLNADGFFTVAERQIPGPEGAPEVTLASYRPANVTEPRPVVYYAHGGGMIIGNRLTGLDIALDWARDLSLTVVSVEYRLAPEHPYPAGVDDAYAGLLWTHEHADEIGGDAERIVVAGESAGGGIAAALALLARDRGGPRLIGQLLLCPMLDDRNDTGSAAQMTGLGIWDKASNEFGWTALLGDRRGTDDVPAYAAPARATDLSGLPPAFVDCGSAETFRDEDVAYAQRLWAAGGQAELHVWPGGFHGFSLLAREAGLSRDAIAARHIWLRRLLAR